MACAEFDAMMPSNHIHVTFKSSSNYFCLLFFWYFNILSCIIFAFCPLFIFFVSHAQNNIYSVSIHSYFFFWRIVFTQLKFSIINFPSWILFMYLFIWISLQRQYNSLMEKVRFSIVYIFMCSFVCILQFKHFAEKWKLGISKGLFRMEEIR